MDFRKSYASFPGGRPAMTVSNAELAAPLDRVVGLLERRVQALEERLEPNRPGTEMPADLSSLMADVVRVTQDLFPGHVSVQVMADPEYPQDRFTVIEAQTSGDVIDVVDRRAEWHRRVARAVSCLLSFASDVGLSGMTGADYIAFAAKIAAAYADAASCRSAIAERTYGAVSLGQLFQPFPQQVRQRREPVCPVVRRAARTPPARIPARPPPPGSGWPPRSPPNDRPVWRTVRGARPGTCAGTRPGFARPGGRRGRRPPGRRGAIRLPPPAAAGCGLRSPARAVSSHQPASVANRSGGWTSGELRQAVPLPSGKAAARAHAKPRRTTRNRRPPPADARPWIACAAR